jgi:hypothetical protein
MLLFSEEALEPSTHTRAHTLSPLSLLFSSVSDSWDILGSKDATRSRITRKALNIDSEIEY